MPREVKNRNVKTLINKHTHVYAPYLWYRNGKGSALITDFGFSSNEVGSSVDVRLEEEEAEECRKCGYCLRVQSVEQAWCFGAQFHNRRSCWCTLERKVGEKILKSVLRVKKKFENKWG